MVLSQEEIQQIQTIVIKLSARLVLLMTRYPDAKAFSRSALKSLKSKTKIVPAFVFLFFGMRFEPNKQYSPYELRRNISENLATDTLMDEVDMLSSFDIKSGQKIFDSSRVSEIIRSLKENKLLSERQNPEKEHGSSKTPGPHHTYELSSDAKRIVTLLSNPQTVERIFNSLENSGLLIEFLKYILAITLYMIRDGDRQELARSMRIVSQGKVNDFPLLKERIDLLQPKLKLLEDKTLEVEAENSAIKLLPYIADYVNRLSFIYGVSEVEVHYIRKS